MRVICAWCRRTIAGETVDADPESESHGICLRCFPEVADEPLQDLPSLTSEQLDALPFGAIRLTPDGTVLAYNRAESELAGLPVRSVLGRNFFDEVAPCTNVRELAGWLADSRALGRSATTRLQFVFAFSSGRVLMDVALSYDAARSTAHILARPAQREGVSA